MKKTAASKILTPSPLAFLTVVDAQRRSGEDFGAAASPSLRTLQIPLFIGTRQDNFIGTDAYPQTPA